MSLVLVTGGGGFVAGHCILQLLEAGYEVRATLRNLAREPGIRKSLEEPGPRLSFVKADLSSDEGWAQAAQGCEFVLHVASPFPAQEPKDENELITPAREGAHRVLRAARDAHVKRVVLTSSFAAIGYGHPPQAEPFDETSWSNTAQIPAYHKSKTIAERAAWDFIAREGGSLELSVVNPVGIFGPALSPDLSSSINIVKKMLEGGMPACPKIYFGAVDVRDVASLHLLAMTSPKAKGERFLAVSGPCVSLFEVGQILRKGLGEKAAKAPKFEMPNWLMRLIALVKPETRGALPELGKIKNSTSAKAERLLGWKPRSRQQAIVATGESLLALGLIKNA